MPAETRFFLGPHEVRIQTGELARQATGAVRLDVEGTSVLATVVAARLPKPGQSFLPLTVDYVEKTYAGGFIPKGMFRREGMPAENETLTARLIDRSLRPLFPKWFKNEVHVVIHVLSSDPLVDPDVPALLAAAATIRVAGLPFDGPVAGLRMAYLQEPLVVNPPRHLQKQSALDLVVCATPRGVVMIEAEADDLPEVLAVVAIDQARQQMEPIWRAMDELAAAAGKPAWPIEAPAEMIVNPQRLAQLARPALDHALLISSPDARDLAMDSLCQRLLTQLGPESRADKAAIQAGLEDLTEFVQRENLAKSGVRADGRRTTQLRPLEMRCGLLPRTHGSSLFTRGQTQALAVVTLGGADEAQTIDGLAGKSRERFLLHYNMPPFAVGEPGRVGPAKRRELGHGHLAKRALAAVIPDEAEFPYVIRVVSEILEANGSSSMASVCAACLALLDAGVPLKDLVAGIAMGASLHDGKLLVLTDITEAEDHLGDMDFKVAGTLHGFTALQMDVKVPGVSLALLEAAMVQAKDARSAILSAMRESRSGEEQRLSPQAPGIQKLSIAPEKIRLVIGRGGSVIRRLCEETGARIHIAEDGSISITAEGATQADEARRRIESLVRDVQVGDLCEGLIVQQLEFYGAILELPGGSRGLLHFEQLPEREAAQWQESLSAGLTLQVRVLEPDTTGQFQLTRLNLESRRERAREDA